MDFPTLFIRAHVYAQGVLDKKSTKTAKESHHVRVEHIFLSKKQRLQPQTLFIYNMNKNKNILKGVVR